MSRVVFTMGGPNPYDKDRPALITMYQRGEGRNAMFSVCYGQQLDNHLNYRRACDKLGEAIMHKLACEGIISNEGK